MDRSIIDEQLAYYRARALEYDRWFLREGRYDRGAEATATWFAEVDAVRSALAGVTLEGADVVEFAPGTGLWTAELAPRAAHLTVVDAAPEMLEQCRQRLGDHAQHVDFVQADLFDWHPPRTWDAAVFCFWISHVPDHALPDFLALVAASLNPGGHVFFLDGRPDPTSTADDHVLPAGDEATMVRRLDDGREFRIYKRFRPAAELEAACASAGLDVAVQNTPTYFQYGVGTRRTGDGA